jgi:hypothetical protein
VNLLSLRDGFPLARLFPYGFRRRLLMPLVRPLHELSLFIAIPIPFLDFADKSVVVPFDLLQVIIGKLAILLFQFAFELRPFPFELIRVHGFLLLCDEMVLPHCSHRSGPVLPTPLDIDQYGEKTGSGLVKSAQAGRINLAGGVAFR